MSGSDIQLHLYDRTDFNRDTKRLAAIE